MLNRVNLIQKYATKSKNMLNTVNLIQKYAKYSPFIPKIC